MPAWGDIEEAHPELIERAATAFGARRYKCLATLKRDGSPRLSETSGVMLAGGEAWLAMIPSAKLRDLDHDDRCSVHCGSPTDEWGVSARFSGNARPASSDDVAAFLAATGRSELTAELLRVDVTEVVVTGPDPDTGDILVEWWSAASGPGRALRTPGSRR